MQKGVIMVLSSDPTLMSVNTTVGDVYFFANLPTPEIICTC